MATARTVRAFEQEMTHLRAIIIEMGAFTQDQLTSALKALDTGDSVLATATAKADKRVDHFDAEAEKLAIELIARRQPLADDLREVIGALKIASQLERVGDYAKNIAKRTLTLLESGEKTDTPAATIQEQGLQALGQSASTLLADCLRAYSDHDIDLAQQVWRSDRQLDTLYQQWMVAHINHIADTPQLVRGGVHRLFIAKNLERIGDLSTNIAEILHYAVTGTLPDGERPKGDTTSLRIPSSTTEIA